MASAAAPVTSNKTINVPIRSASFFSAAYFAFALYIIISEAVIHGDVNKNYAVILAAQAAELVFIISQNE